jgi:hypothetical protein
MPYGVIKVDQVTFTNAGVDQTISVSGIVASISGNITATGTISGDVIRGGTTVSGATVTGTAGRFGTVTGNTAGFTTVTGTTASFTSGVFTSISGGTHTITSGVFASGTAAAPSITFAGDLDTGVYASATNQVSITTSGTERLRIDATGQIEAASLGTAAAPAYSFTADPDTGVYSPGTNQLAISTAGTGRLFVDANGNVGVGTGGTQSSKFHVEGTSRFVGAPSAIFNGTTGTYSTWLYNETSVGDIGTSNQVFSGGANTDFAITSRGVTALVFGTNATERMRIDSSGRVGIGTSSPGTALEVNGFIQTQSGAFGGGGYNIKYNAGNAASRSWQLLTDNTAYGDLTIQQSTTQTGSTYASRLYISAAGNVGIGTTSPGASLDVSSGTSGTAAVVKIQDPAGRVVQIASPSSSTEAYIGTTTSHRLDFYTNNTVKATLDTSGRLGIGTSSPSALLHVNGDAQVNSLNGGPLAGFRNAIINGNFDIWQRGTSFTASEYGADRWVHARTGTTHTVTRQAFTLGQTAVPGEPEYFCRTVVSSVAGAANYDILAQRIEDVRTFAGQQITISFWAKADATKNIAINMVQNFGTGGSPSANVGISGTKVSIGTTFQKVTVTATLPSISGKTLGTDNNHFLYLNIWFDAGSIFNGDTDSLGQQSGTFDIAQVQIEPGPVATPFEQRPIGTELSLCQRYYLEAAAHAQGPVPGAMTTPIYFPVSMRATPTRTNVSAGSSNGVDSTIITVFDNSSARCQISITLNGGFVVNRVDAYSAEL